ncbi:phage tail protein [Sphingobacterium sp. SYP-B4668]|uniref:phage tail protein n=1 Tax=Sphingobacterium sp. SYP-B4668 TaxID=2996035 RepID=UPI0022DD3919|nr:tail fiber protein [Sphingobacterium sp. SYP-B4668]
MEPFLGMICTFGFNFAPRGWAICGGQLIAIQQNSALFALIGTYYGGNGQNTFGLPDLRGRVMIGAGQSPGLSNYNIGEVGGAENFTLTINQLPAHSHFIPATTSAGNTSNPTNARLAASPKVGSGPNASTLNTYSNDTAAANATMPTQIIGNNLPTPLIQPYLAVNHCIAIEGIFPSRN